MECFFRGKPFDDDGKSTRGYRKRMMQEWKELGVFEITEQRLCDQARAVRKNGWLSNLELENIRRMIGAESEIGNESIKDVEENQSERDNMAINVETLDEETQLIIAQLNKILAGGRNTDGIFSLKKLI